MTDDELFSVWQFFPNEMSECVGSGLSAEDAVNLAKSYTTRPAARVGIIQRVRIVDGGDCCVFEWINGKGVTFPAAEQCAEIAGVRH